MHNIETPWIRTSLGTIGMIASTILLLVSMAANYRYGFTLARTPTDGQVYAIGAAAVDVVMALCPFFFFAALETFSENKGRAVTQAFFSFLLWAVFMVFAFQAVVSHASANRLDAASTRMVTANTYADVRTELAEAREARKRLQWHRPEATVKAEIEKHKTQRQWSLTTECTEPAGKTAREYCAQYQTFVSELGSAQQAAKLDARIEALTAKSDKVADQSGTVVASEADPGARTWATVLGVDLRTMQGIITFGFAGVILLGASLGHYCSFSLLQGRRRRMIVVDAETATRADVKEATKELLALSPPKPKVLPEIIVRPDPSPEARALLTAADFPVKAPRGPLRQRDKRDVLPLRFALWLRAHEIAGEHESSKLQAIYLEYAQADHREPWDWRIVAKEITEGLGRFNVAKAMRKDKTDGVTRTYFTLRQPALDKLKEVLAKKGVLKEPDPPPGAKKKGSNIFPLALSGAPAPKATPETSTGPTAKSKSPVKGRAELHPLGGQPDIEGMRALARQHKAMWREKLSVFQRKQRNRFSRARGAA